jgi:hypothetical protein
METPDDVRPSPTPHGRPAGRNDAAANEQSVEHLKSEITETQAELQQTVAEIQERLSPTHLKAQATGAIHEATVGRMKHMINRAGDRLGDAAGQGRSAADRAWAGLSRNPVPYALIAVGAGWLLAAPNTRRREWDESRSFADADTSFAEEELTQSNWSDPDTSNVQWREPSRPYRTSPGAASGNRLGQVATQARSRWETMLSENPLVLGIAALAAGALVGAVLPSTEVESRYMGEARDAVLETAREGVQTVVEHVGEPQG